MKLRESRGKWCDRCYISFFLKCTHTYTFFQPNFGQLVYTFQRKKQFQHAGRQASSQVSKMIDNVCLMNGSTKKTVHSTNFQRINTPNERKNNRLDLAIESFIVILWNCVLSVEWMGMCLCVCSFFRYLSKVKKKTSTQFQNIGLFIQPFFLFSPNCLYNLSLIFSVRIAMLFIENGAHVFSSSLVNIYLLA